MAMRNLSEKIFADRIITTETSDKSVCAILMHDQNVTSHAGQSDEDLRIKYQHGTAFTWLELRSGDSLFMFESQNEFSADRFTCFAGKDEGDILDDDDDDDDDDLQDDDDELEPDDDMLDDDDDDDDFEDDDDE